MVSAGEVEGRGSCLKTGAGEMYDRYSLTTVDSLLGELVISFTALTAV